MKVAKRMQLIKPSGTIAMAEKARELQKAGRKILNLDVGEPDFDTPEHIKQAAIEAIRSGFTHYTSSKGILELRQAISEDLASRNIEANPESEIVVTPGGKHALYCACLATLDPKDEVLVLAPTWPTHFQCVECAEARANEIPCGPSYALDEEALKNKITSKTKMVLVGSPNNPTGGVMRPDEIRVIVDLAVDHDLLILSDEIYDRIIYDNYKIRSPASFDDGRERCIVINGFSKAYAMTGWRMGYAFASKDIADAIVTIQQSTTTCPASFVQKAGIAALRGPQDIISEMVQEYDRRRKFIVNQLNNIQGLSCNMPKGAFYVFPKIEKPGVSSLDFCSRLLKKEGVSTTPGSVFGESGEGYVRMSYATSLETIGEAVNKIKVFVENYV
ncbi:pyridoxal phosphate-dependent aminotransferase [Candidatus Bathyarchaeota archaeon]|nr:pyridoxal phosphate-dependent aminotransferase [Candidatus Bathyarchaeota archaeon]